MTGTAYFGCGSADDEHELWQLMLQRPETRILYWPFALPPTMIDSADAWLRGNLDRIGACYELTTWRGLDERRVDGVDRKQFDLLFVGGGNTFRLLHAVRDAGFIDQVRRFFADGGDYYGGSAGAVLACDDIAIADGHDPNDVDLRDLTALGIIPKVAILPHFTEDQIRSARQWAERHRTVVLGMPESIGLRYASNRADVIGSGELVRVDAESVRRFSAGRALEIG